MKTNVIYTSSEIDLLYREVTSNFNKYCARDIKESIQNFNNQLKPDDKVIYSIFLGIANEFTNYEPYGEGKVFVLFYSMNSMEFSFCTRHLKKFLFEYTLEDMPLLMNTHFIGTLATWRMKIAK